MFTLPSARSRRTAIAAAVSVLSFASLASATPLLTYDLRLASTGGKTATVAGPGDVVTMNLYALISGSDLSLANEGFYLGSGSFFTSAGGLKGDLLSSTVAPFDGPGSAGGTQRDLDSDGDLDVGGTSTTSVDGRAAYLTGLNPAMDMPAGGFLLGTVRLTITSSLEASTQVRFVPRIMTIGGASGPLVNRFVVDGVSTSLRGDSPDLAVGAPVTISLTAPPVVIGDGTTQVLSGTISTHVSVGGRATPAPGGILILDKGLDVTSGGVFDCRDNAGSFGAHELRVNDATSGNANGQIYVAKLKVGTSAAGTFRQTAGFTQVATEISAGVSAGISGAIVIDGGTITSPLLNVGVAGAGTYTQTGGVANIITLNMSTTATGPSTATISGGILNIGGESSIGKLAPATVEVTGGTVNATSYLTLGDGRGVTSPSNSIGHLIISGGTTIANSLALGRNGGIGTVVQTNGVVNAQIISVGDGIAPVGTGQYDLNGGTLNAQGVVVLGPGLFAQNGGTFNADLIRVGTNVRINGGTLTARAITVAGGLYDQTAGAVSVGEVDIIKNSTLKLTGGSFSLTRDLNSAGQFDFGNAAVTLSVGNNAFVNFSKGSVTNAGNASIVAGVGSLITFPATFNPLVDLGHITTQGLVHVDGQVLIIPPGQSINGSGTITGDVSNQGTISPGHSPGQIIVEGNFTQASVASMFIELAGTAAESFDSISITGNLSLDGQLQVALLDGFLPLPTDQFTFLTATSLSGIFANAPSTIATNGGEFDVLYTPTSVTLTDFSPVPEPAMLSLAALLPLVSRRRRR